MDLSEVERRTVGVGDNVGSALPVGAETGGENVEAEEVLGEGCCG